MEAISVNSLIEYPYEAYLEFNRRLALQGSNAPFPEFKQAVDFLSGAIGNAKFTAILKDHPDLSLELKEVQTLFAHINLVFSFDDELNYPYSRPFDAPFPYRPTIDAIEAAIRLLDKLNRLEPNNHAVPHYHFDRYAYHRHSLIADPNVVLFPIARDLSFYDLIRVRSVPIGFLGVISETIRVDRHWQSPLDFWYHDMNHVRRMYEYMKYRERKKSLKGDAEIVNFYHDMDDFIKKTIIPAISELPDTADEEAIAVRRIVRVIIFEIFHETALTAEKESIVEDVLRESGPQPFEYMLTENQDIKPDNIEKLRTPTGNIESGASLVKKDKNSPLKIRYFFDRALALLANVYNKLNFGFYDDPDSPSELVVPIKFREPKYIVKAVKQLFQALEVRVIPSDEKLLSLITSREGAEEKFVYKGTVNKDDKQKQYATDPVSADTVISEIKRLGKQIYTLFGYSLLEYENKSAVLELIRSELKGLDPQNTIINIGATVEGIGGAYEIAKELGFQTIGIVSTQALFYSGKFSEFVDRIYIINDMNWGGYVPGTTNLAETTKAYLAVSDTISAFGGGENTAIILRLAREHGINVKFTPSQMNHRIAREIHKDKAIDFNGAAHRVWAEIDQPTNLPG